jgi:hypothetical protein
MEKILKDKSYMEISGDEMHREKSDKLGNKLISKTT